MFRFLVGFFVGGLYVIIYTSQNPNSILLKIGTMVKAIFLG